jgi:16S rRNA (cytosine1402-N4)-methyltransferase
MEQLYHVPVMGQEVVNYLVGNKKGIYLDGTLGGGGHAQIILDNLDADALYIAVDRDMEAVDTAKERLKLYKNFKAHCLTFDKIEEVLSREKVKKLDGVLLDLGVSSWQIDQDKRGFSFRPGLKLDMRMDDSQDLTAEWVVNNYTKEELIRIFKEYGEERFSGRIAHLIVTQRSKQKIVSSSDLIKIIDKCVNPRFATKSYARIFQAIRIEVNDELNILKETLEEAVRFLDEKGRLAVITYHSLEDRIVKNFFRDQENPCICPPELPVCVCGRQATMKRIKPLFIQASQDEIKSNPRSRSAKLRVAEKI